MGKEMRIAYDKEGDILDISLGRPQRAISKEVEDDFFVRVDSITGEVVGFSVLNFEKWFKELKDFKTLPIYAEFILPSSGGNQGMASATIP